MKYVQALLLTLSLILFHQGTKAASQEPTPVQSGPQFEYGLASNPQGDNDIADTIKQITENANTILTNLLEHIVKPLLEYFQPISFVLAIILFFVGFMKLGVRGADYTSGSAFLFRFWMALVAVFLGNTLLGGMQNMGFAFAYGSKDAPCRLETYCRIEEALFNLHYERYVKSRFFVKTDDDFAETSDGWLGVLKPNEISAKNLAQAAKEYDPQGWTMSGVLSWLQVSIILFQFSNLFLVLLHFLIRLAFVLMFSWMAALWVDPDKKAATGEYAWGAFIFLFAYPIGMQAIRFLFYYLGKFAFMIGNEKPLFAWDMEGLTTVGQASGTTFRTWALVVMSICFAVINLLSPILVYALTSGKVYQAAASTGSQVLGFMTTVGGSLVYSRLGQGLSMGAEMIGEQAKQDTAIQRAQTQRDVANRGADLRAVEKSMQAQSARTSALAGLASQFVAARMSNDAQNAFANRNSNNTTEAHNKGLEAGRQLQTDLNNITHFSQIGNAGANLAGNAVTLGGQLFEKVLEKVSPAEGLLRKGGGSSGIPNTLGNGVSNIGQGIVAEIGRRYVNEAQGVYFDTQLTTSNTLNDRQKESNDKLRFGLDEAAQAQYSIAAGGINRATDMQLGAIEAVRRGEHGINNQVFKTESEIAAAMYEAGVEASKSRAQAGLITAVGGSVTHGISKLIEENRPQ